MENTQQRITESVRALSAAFQDQQTGLAKVLGMSQVSVSRKMRGLNRWSVDDVEKLAVHWGVSAAQILAGPRAWLGLNRGRGDTAEYRSDGLPAMAA